MKITFFFPFFLFFYTEMEEILYIGGFRVGQYCDYEKQCNDDAPTFVNLVASARKIEIQTIILLKRNFL